MPYIFRLSRYKSNQSQAVAWLFSCNKRMMNRKLRLRTLILIFVLTALGAQSCTPSGGDTLDTLPATSTPGEIPTWTPRPQDLPSLPTETKPAPDTQAESATPTGINTPFTTPTPRSVTISISGGNLNVRRGPSISYNYVGVLYDGETAVAIARDRISRWILIEIPSNPGKRGWVTTETEYTDVQGDPGNLPFLEEEPASPAFIRNCTKHTILILPDYVELLNKYNGPYNEERFGVGVYQVIDIDIPGTAQLDEISLSEGKTVDIIYDGAGTKSKCE